MAGRTPPSSPSPPHLARLDADGDADPNRNEEHVSLAWIAGVFIGVSGLAIGAVAIVRRRRRSRCTRLEDQREAGEKARPVISVGHAHHERH